MTRDELRSALAAILSAELAGKWEEVDAFSEQTYIRLTTELETPLDYPYEEVVGYLAGIFRRRSDSAFADQQRRWLRSYLDDSSS